MKESGITIHLKERRQREPKNWGSADNSTEELFTPKQIISIEKFVLHEAIENTLILSGTWNEEGGKIHKFSSFSVRKNVLEEELTAAYAAAGAPSQHPRRNLLPSLLFDICCQTGGEDARYAAARSRTPATAVAVFVEKGREGETVAASMPSISRSATAAVASPPLQLRPPPSRPSICWTRRRDSRCLAIPHRRRRRRSIVRSESERRRSCWKKFLYAKKGN
nr:hypothetical protein Itr_chr07CG07720 [Ipomoea trifida]GLL46358.1 hypothetical protein Itr_chr14CG10220 [Ipomoea trifida]